jgi:hypothetical protein
MFGHFDRGVIEGSYLVAYQDD